MYLCVCVCVCVYVIEIILKKFINNKKYALNFTTCNIFNWYFLRK